jgi:hypothetical protein
MVFADPTDAETNGTVLKYLQIIRGGQMVRIYPRRAILVQPDDKTLPLTGPARGVGPIRVAE